MKYYIHFLFLIPTLVFAQSKKETIDILTYRIDSLTAANDDLLISFGQSEHFKDSLNELLVNERQQFASKMAETDAEIKMLNASISELKQQISQLNIIIGNSFDSLKLERESRAILMGQIQKNELELQELTLLRAEIQKLKNSELDYESIEIDGTLWMVENLRVKKFQNGDPIPQATDAAEWVNAASNGTPAFCFYNFDPANEEKYGILYNYYVVADARGIGNEGWRAASQGEVWMLLHRIGVENPREEIAGSPLGKKLIDKTSFKNYPGTNAIGFNITATGCALSDETQDGSLFWGKNQISGFWSESGALTVESSPYTGSLPGLTYPNYFWGGDAHGFGLPIRLVKTLD